MINTQAWRVICKSLAGSEIQIFRVKQMKHSTLPSHFKSYHKIMSHTWAGLEFLYSQSNLQNQTFWAKLLKTAQTSVELCPAFKNKILMMMNTQEFAIQFTTFVASGGCQWLALALSSRNSSRFFRYAENWPPFPCSGFSAFSCHLQHTAHPPHAYLDS